MIMSKIGKLFGKDNMPTPKLLYNEVKDAGKRGYGWEESDKGENITVINESIGGWWKPRYLLNHETKCAYEIMDSSCTLKIVSQDDIDWNSVKHLEDYCVRQARSLNAHYPTLIRGFRDGIGFVEWQLNPDGRYFMDEDGFGMTDYEEVSLFGFIDKNGKVVAKFRVINNAKEEAEMRKEALRAVKHK